MRHDVVIKSIRYMLNISNAKIAEILQLGGYKPTREDLELIFMDVDEDAEEEKEDISHELMAHFLDGLIYFKRGKSDKHPPRPIEIPVTNNDVLKKMRVAFKLREEQILNILKSAGFEVASAELSALFRDKNHRNYRPCGDQLLRYFLRGLTTKVRRE
ncbi:MAG: DUF1456 family protein [Balneolaceae bacterium]